MRRQLFLSAAAVALLVTGAAAQTTRDEQPRAGSQARSLESTPQRRQVERIPDVNRQKKQAAQPRGAAEAQGRRNAAQPAQGNTTQLPQNSAAQQNSAQQQTGQQPTQHNNATAPNQNTGTAQRTPPSAQPAPAAGTQQQQTGQPQQPQQSGQSAQPTQSQTRQRAPQPTQNTGSGAQQRGSGVVSLNTQQQTRIGQTIARHNVKPLTNVNFSISVGTRVPRSVTLRALPADLVTFVPQYRGYSYFVVEEQIVIVEPSSLEIVSIVPYSGKTVRSAKAPMASRSVSLSTEQRDAIRKHAVKKQTTRESSTRKIYKPGDVVERSVTIESFPETVYEEVPVVRRYRYFTDDDDVILVDPDEDRVVDVIR
jgi:hypothetical protein